MKKAWLVLIAIVLFCAGSIQAEAEFWGNVEHGDSNTIGNFDFYEDGTSATRIGNSKFYSNGVSETHIGSFTFRSDGQSSTEIGDFHFRSNGNTGTDIGKFQFNDNGPTIYKFDGYTGTSK
jgi:acetyltransferase-like isoleucine patch superfamily enzyme